MKKLLPVALAVLVVLSACSTAPPKAPALALDRPASRLRADTDLERRWLSICQEVEDRPYRSGGTDRKGFDCSGLVRYAYHRYDGRTLPRTTRDLYRTGRPVEKLKTGDLLFYGAPNHRPTHVGIYLWESWFLHAAQDGVRLSSVSEQYYRERFLGARRLP